MNTVYHNAIIEEPHLSDEKLDMIKQINDIDQQSSVHLGNLHAELLEADNMFSAAKLKLPSNNEQNQHTFISQSLLSQSDLSPGHRGPNERDVTVVSYSDSSSANLESDADKRMSMIQGLSNSILDSTHKSLVRIESVTHQAELQKIMSDNLAKIQESNSQITDKSMSPEKDNMH